MGILKVGDKVMWRGSWGRDSPKEVKVAGIEVDCKYKSGDAVDWVDWEDVKSGEVIVDLDNGHWGYGSQIYPI